MSCILSARLSILVNRNPFSMGRGLRQEDLLSLLLFIIALEALNVMIVEAALKGLYQGFQIGKEHLHFSHLQFADDALSGQLVIQQCKQST